MVVLTVVSIGLIVNSTGKAYAEESFVPTWVRTTALWWGEEKINDQDFINAIQFLIEKKIVIIQEPEEFSEENCGPGTIYDQLLDECIIRDESESSEIFPEALATHQSVITSWIKVTALWWGQGKINNQDFVDALEYLAENKILQIPKQKIEEPLVEEPLRGENLLEKYPTYTSSWTLIDRIEDFQVQGHSVSEDYFLRFTVISEDEKEISSDGTVSISIMDEFNRILYLDSFSVKKNDFSKVTETFSGDELTVYSWEIPTGDIKKGFGDFGIAKIVFTDRGGNSFSDEFDAVSIPKFG